MPLLRRGRFGTPASVGLSALLVWAIWFVAARTFSLVGIGLRTIFADDTAAWFGIEQRAWTAVQTALTAVAPFGSAIHLGYDWKLPLPDPLFWLLALLLPVLFQCAYRFWSGKSRFRDGLVPGVIAAAWIVLSIVFEVGTGVLVAGRLMPGTIDTWAHIGTVIGHTLVAVPFLVLWVVLGSSAVSAAIMRPLSHGTDTALSEGV